MKDHSHRFRTGTGWLAVVLLALWFTGCATPKVDWASRVGSYTFDQAVIESGPPDKQAKLADGTLVAEWLTHRGYAQSYPAVPYYGYRPWESYGPVFPAYINSYSPDCFLRLTFDPQGRLKAWKKFAR
jgi:hypothetical protein